MAIPTVQLNQLSRYRRLATPKSLPTGFLEDRRSVYWEDAPLKDYTKTTAFVLTPRQKQLVYSKHLHPDYLGDRPSPAWPVSHTALQATPTSRLLQLATPKQLHHDYHPCRQQVMTLVPGAALHVAPTERLARLAHHKTYPPLHVRHNTEWDWGEWSSDVSPAAKTAEASARVTELASPKRDHLMYRPCKDVQWPVSRVVRSHTATELTLKLSQPKNRNADLEDYNPRAWSVSRAALLAQSSPRLAELATPLPRKCRVSKQ